MQPSKSTEVQNLTYFGFCINYFCLLLAVISLLSIEHTTAQKYSHRFVILRTFEVTPARNIGLLKQQV